MIFATELLRSCFFYSSRRFSVNWKRRHFFEFPARLLPFTMSRRICVLGFVGKFNKICGFFVNTLYVFSFVMFSS